MSGSDDDDVVPAAAATLRLKWDVFISFRGEDTRQGFTMKLYRSLIERGVRAFLDDEGMKQGDEIAPSLLEAIDDSAISIVIISRRYADSHWCLDELARITELRRLILPVFYEVDPSHVKRQKGPFEQDFRNHLIKFGEDRVNKWRQAMEKVGGGFEGWPFDSSKEKQLIEELVKRVLTELRKIPVGLATYPVGLDSRVERLTSLLDVKSKRIIVLGLYGMGGVGKTTLATALYNKVIAHFPYRCFISNVRETCQKVDGLVSLQNKLLGDLSSKAASHVSDVDAGITAIKLMVQEKRALLVLDDVDDVEQLDALAGKRDWFGEGSRIIITTRDKSVLVDHMVNEPHEVRELYPEDALKLFSYHAFRREKPTDDFLNLSRQIVSLASGLPLALEVFGSFLFDKRRMEEWEDALKKLQQIQPYNLQDVLRISFSGLDEDFKPVFLDIACLFVPIGMEREEAIDILKGCGFRAETAITDLTAKCLIKIREDYTIWMHDQVRDMGRQIVRQENHVNPGRRSRLWDHNEIINVLKHNEGSVCVEGIILHFREKNPRADVITWNSLLETPNCTNALLYLKGKFQEWLRNMAKGEEKEIIHTKSFETMVNLRLLRINHVKLKGKFSVLPTHLKWLQWQGCSLKSLPHNYSPSQLAVLDLSRSSIERVWGWGNNKVAEKLAVLNLHHCHNLVAIPDLTGLTSLEKLNLEHCVHLTKIHESVGNVRSLLYLNLTGCSNLVELPSDLSGLKNLQKLFLSECTKLKELPEDLGYMKSLKELLVDRTSISKLPESIFRLTKLEKLSLNGCQSLRQLPQCLGNLRSLKELSLNESSLEELPDSVGSLSCLVKLSLMRCDSLTTVPESVGNLQSLKQLLVNSSSIKELPASIGSLPYLKELSAGGCKSLCKLPDSLEGLASLNKLQLDGTPIKSLPPLPSSLEELIAANCIQLESISDISNLENLELLNLANCEKVVNIPGLERLKSLRRLYLTGCKACSLAAQRRLSKTCLRNMRNLSMPGSEIPDWFSQEVTFSERKNHKLRAVIIGVVVSLDHQTPHDSMVELPVLPDILVRILKSNEVKSSTALYLRGLPRSHEDQMYMCWYPHFHPLVSMLEEGYTIDVIKSNPSFIEGVHLKKHGIYLVYENDDEYGGNEEALDESQQSVSQRLANFFNSIQFNEMGQVS